MVDFTVNMIVLGDDTSDQTGCTTLKCILYPSYKQRGKYDIS